jgi:hypothetical protein
MVASGLLLTSCGGSSAPVIVSGTIETYGDEVGVAVYRVSDHYASDPIDYRQSKGTFELRGTMSASDARDLFLAVYPPTLLPNSCGATVNLPPLRLSEGRWVNAGTGQPVVLDIELRETLNYDADPDVRCPPEDQGSGTDTSTGS